MSSLGKSYTNFSDQSGTFDSRSQQEPEAVTRKRRNSQAGSTEIGGPGPSFRQPPVEDQTRASKTHLQSKSNPQSLEQVSETNRIDRQAARQPISKTLRDQVLKRDHYYCVTCEASPLLDKKVKLEIDHVVPVSRGGTNDTHNLQTLCHNCNQKKKASLV